ncbi:hypothetical protein S101189_01159 [Pediococcus acidilactici]|uniref:hypothetical protein n=1 Tax=Pediococcus acidilactici TaxID=1254 RepID=UPI0007EF25DF|nr:hypothetical protein [Pediococcus acidilactici]ARW24595.1 hypothetical protein S100424_01159 [Pediococcus acidilactici]ARW26637.1 hypothetical protein S100313_01202 [Pediococcus acidilactici]ARW28713.1 hypothetical protein S101189_01159 [Pediococcus acidilactici]KAF0344963.1 hypothetical protein GBO41_02375 [Pediococcus acidilactici]OBR30910.1 hypothetical protein SRCM100320_00403 [Pediococcus acidilactici]
MGLTSEIEIYFFNNNIATLDFETSKQGWVYITTDAEQPMFRYHTKSPELLQHNLSNNRWCDIWLGIRKQQLVLF